MKSLLPMLAQRGANSPINKWLAENPLVLGLISLALGGGILAYGLYELKSGVSRDKRGRQIQGGAGRAMTYLRIGFGAVIILFGLFKMLLG
jgi:hypothetical protein